MLLSCVLPQPPLVLPLPVQHLSRGVRWLSRQEVVRWVAPRKRILQRNAVATIVLQTGEVQTGGRRRLGAGGWEQTGTCRRKTGECRRVSVGAGGYMAPKRDGSGLGVGRVGRLGPHALMGDGAAHRKPSCGDV